MIFFNDFSKSEYKKIRKKYKGRDFIIMLVGAPSKKKTLPKIYEINMTEENFKKK